MNQCSVFSETATSAGWDGISKLLIVPAKSFHNMLLKYLSFVDPLFIYLHITCCSGDSYRQLSRFASLKPRPPLPNNWTRTNEPTCCEETHISDRNLPVKGNMLIIVSLLKGQKSAWNVKEKCFWHSLSERLGVIGMSVTGKENPKKNTPAFQVCFLWVKRVAPAV